MSMREIIESIEREMFDRATREENNLTREFLNRKEKYYIHIHSFLAEPMKYKVMGEEYAKDTVPVVTIEFENGKVQEVNLTELMEYDTLEKCKIRCEKMNKDMQKYREDWNKNFPYIQYLLGESHETEVSN